MRLALASAYYSYQGFGWMPPSILIAQKVFIPLSQIAFFSLIGAHLGDQPLDFYLIGNAVLIATLACFHMAWAIASERNAGTLQYVVASPASRMAVFFGRSAWYIVDGAVSVAMGLAWAGLAFGLELDAGGWAKVGLAVLTAVLAASGLGLVVGGLSYVILDVVILGNAVTFALLLFSGANIPTESLPPVFQTVGLALPVTRSIAAAREIASGSSLAHVAPLLLGDLVVGLVYALAGFLLFRWLEVQARRRGTLEGF